MTTTTPTYHGPGRDPVDHTARPTNPWLGMAVLSLSLLVVVMDMTILNVAVPAISADLRPTSVELLWTIDAYSLVIAGLLVTAASLGDRWGRRHLLIAGYVTFAAASAAVLLVDSPSGLIATRVALGVGGAMIMPSTLSMIRGLFPDARQRATALGIWAATAGVGAALGPIVGGVLVERFDWHAAFLVNVPVMVLAIAGALLLLPQSRSARPGALDVLGTALSIVGMTSLVYAIKHLGELDAKTLVVGLLAVVTLTWFVRRCLSRPDPVLEVRLFARRGVTAGAVAALSSMVALTAMMLLGAQWLQLVQNFSPIEAGFALMPAAIGGAVFSPLAPAAADRLGVRTVLAGGLAIGAVGFALLWVAPAPLSLGWVLASFLLVGISTGSLAVASALVMAGAPADKAGSAAAIDETSYEVGAALGVAILGSAGAALYRSELPADRLAESGLSTSAIDSVRESLTGALEVADRLGGPGTALADAARDAFSDSLAGVGLLGGGVMLVAAVVVALLTPRDVQLSDAEH